MRHRMIIIAMTCLAGCHRQTANPGLSLVPFVQQAINAQGKPPEYLEPTDSVTAGLIADLAAARGFKIGRPASGLACPWSASSLPKGYAVTITIESLGKNEGTGRWQIACAEPSRRRGFANGGTVTLRRDGRKWKATELHGWIT